MVGLMGHSIMLSSEPAATTAHLKSRFLDGLPPGDLKVVLAAARHRHFLANSVVVNQGHPADQGPRPIFLQHARREKSRSSLAYAGRNIRRLSAFVDPLPLSRQYRNTE